MNPVCNGEALPNKKIAFVKKPRKNPVKKSYARIDFINCEPNYSYCVCEWADVENQMSVAASSFEDISKTEYQRLKKNNELPEIKVSLILLTEKQFSKYIDACDK